VNNIKERFLSFTNNYTSLEEEFIKNDLYFLNNLNIYNKRLYSDYELREVRSLENLYSLFLASSLDSITFLENLLEKKDSIA
jgi:hypothetical protein